MRTAGLLQLPASRLAENSPGVARHNYEGTSRHCDLYVQRYNDDGNPDPSFIFNSYVLRISDFTCVWKTDVAQQSNGRIVVALSMERVLPDQTEDIDYAVFRYTSDGLLDNSFGLYGGYARTHGGDGPVLA